jgi:ankyrin repeat protein
MAMAANVVKLSNIVLLSLVLCWSSTVKAQTPPSATEVSQYTGIMAAAAEGDANELKELIAKGENPNIRDNHGRTPLHVAAFRGHHAVMRILANAGVDPNALENDRYDIVTIAAVENDIPTLKLSLELGGSAKNITSRYDGTALIAAAHLGHFEVVQMLINAGAPLDHINNLGWTALIESIVLGDGGERHSKTLKALVDAGADVNIADQLEQTPLSLARSRGYQKMVSILEAAGGVE